MEEGIAVSCIEAKGETEVDTLLPESGSETGSVATLPPYKEVEK